MAIGKISGPMLQTNLVRQGVDLAIDTDAVYVDVTNRRLGVNTITPTQALDIKGNAHIGNLSILANTITSDTGKINLGTIANVVITGGSPNYIIYTDGAGNLSFGNLDVLSGLEGFTANYITLGSNTVGSYSNAAALSTSTTVADAIAIVNLNLGNVTANVQSLQRQVYANANVASYLPVYTGNIAASSVIVSTGFNGNVYTDYISPNTATSTKFTGTAGIGLPVGNNSNKPAGYSGQIRFNSDLTVIEFYNGSGWIPVTNTITDQQITPDGIYNTFVLNQTTTSAGIIVSINGTLQAPGVAYTVSGNQITFAEVPQTTDIVDIRFIATAVTSNFDYESIDTANVAVGTALTIADSFNSTMFRSAKYTISSTNSDAQFYEVMLTQYNGTTAVNTIGNVRTGSNFITFTANASGTTVNLLAQSNTNSNNLRIKRTYFNA
jgi:hypothetical protein